MANDVDDFRPGVLNKKQMKILSNNKYIKNLREEEIGLSSFDLHLSNEGCETIGGIKPAENGTCDEIKRDYKIGNTFNLNEPTTLETRKTYLIQLEEGLNLTDDMQLYGMATGKSSIGRLDVLTRLLVDKLCSYDIVGKGHGGSLYLEVTPITFPIKVQKGVALNQLRLFRGHPDLSIIDKEELYLYKDLLLFGVGDPVPKDEVSKLRVNLSPNINGFSAFRAKRETPEIDLTKGKKHYLPKDFWEPIKYERDKPLEIEPEDFYILRSKERLQLPGDVAVSCQAISETLGELRIHYAGFAHPFFGRHNGGEGTPLIFEVRGHNVKTYLRDGETLAHIKFHRMSEPAIDLGPEDYGKQELKLSNYFKDWEQD